MEMDESCPNKKNHTNQPSGYIAWHDWAQKKTKTHRQVRCQGCGLFSIWVPRKSRKK